MDDVSDLITFLHDRGVVLSVVSGPPERLTCRARRGLLTPDLLERVRRHRDAIIASVKAEETRHATPVLRPPEPCRACKGIRFWSLGNGHWVCGTCHPPAPGALERGVTWREGRPKPGDP